MKAVPEHPLIPQIVNRIAQHELGHGNVDVALERITQQNDAIGGHPLLLQRKAQILLAQGQPGLALGAVRQLESLVSMEQLYSRLAIDLTLLHARILAILDRPAEGVALLLPYAHVAVEQEGHRPDLAPLLSDVIASQAGQPGLSLILESLHQVLPEFRHLKYDLGKVLVTEGKFKEALELLDTFVTDTDADGQFLRYYALAQSGRLEEAARALEVALASAPQDLRGVLLANLAQLHERLGQRNLAESEYARAAVEYTDALDANPVDMRALQGLLELEQSHPAVVPAADLNQRLERAMKVTRDPGLRQQIEQLLHKRQP
ncbi:MAG: hypothetical protein U1E76_01195 [Planctomycetota bacterium]